MNPQDPDFIDTVLTQTMALAKERRANAEKQRQNASRELYGHPEAGVFDIKYMTKEDEHRLVIETTLKMAGLR
jgi:hypothetical protein